MPVPAEPRPVEPTLYKAYLDCLFLDREALQNLLDQTQTYDSAFLAANSLLEHMRMHPMLSTLNLPEGDKIKPHEMPVILDYLHRALWRLFQRGKQEDFLQTIQQELAYLIPRLWNAPKAQKSEIKNIEQRLLANAKMYQNQSLIDVLEQPQQLTPAQLLKSVDDTLAVAWPKQLGLIVTQNQELLQKIQENTNVSGIEWRIFDNLSAALQTKIYQDPNIIIVTLDQPRVTLERLLSNFPRTEAIGVVDDMATLKDHMLPARIRHILEKKWLNRFLPGVIQRNLLQRWRDTRSLSTDFLTRLPALMGMREQFASLKELFSRIKGPMTLAVLEIPVLSAIETQEGPYLTGEWLKSFARFMQECLRNTDIIGRWAPDKFILLLPQTNLEGARVAMERCHEQLPQNLPIPIDNPESQQIFISGMTAIHDEVRFESALFNAYRQLEKARNTPDEPFYYDKEELKKSVRPHILLLDDDPIIQEMLRFVLSREGYEITQLTDGRDVLKTLEEKPVSLVILDLKMPGMDGFEVLEVIRSQRIYDTLPVVILSSMKGETDLEKGFDLGADDYIYKPFSPSELMIRIRRFLR